MHLRFTLLCGLVLAAGACSLNHAIERAGDTIVSATADEIARGIRNGSQRSREDQRREEERRRDEQRRLDEERRTQPSQSARSQPAQQAVVASASSPAPRHTTALFAVLDFKNRIKGKDAESVDAVYFANQVRSAVKRTAPKAKVMTRENIIVLLESQGKAISDCEGECEVDTGRKLGADMVVSGDLIKIGGTWKLDLRLHQTSDGQLISGAAASGKSPDDLDQDSTRAVAELLSPLP